MESWLPYSDYVVSRHVYGTRTPSAARTVPYSSPYWIVLPFAMNLTVVPS